MGAGAGDERGWLQTIAFGHGDIEDDHGGREGFGHGHGLFAVAGFADDFKAGIFAENEAEAFADNAMVVGHEDANHRAVTGWARGISARSRVPAPGTDSTTRRPPSSRTRSSMPMRPRPRRRETSKPAPLSSTVRARREGEAVSCTRTWRARAWRAQLVSASCNSR